jgi:hypothetical protein
MSTLSDYTALIPPANSLQPNFLSVLAAALQPYVDLINAVEAFPSGNYDVDVAVGEQLDVVGQWVGVSRVVPLPIANVYFSFDVAGLGFDEGIWWAPGDPDSSSVTLDDDTYRVLIKAKIAANRWDGSLSGLQQILADIFAGTPGCYPFVIDNFDMTFVIAIAGNLPTSIVQQLFAQQYIPIRPFGVLLDAAYTTGTSGAPIFGLDVQNNYIAGLDVGALAVQIV